MITIQAIPGKPIRLGRLGENERIRVAFDISAFQEELPGATFVLINKGPGDKEPYPCPGVTVEGSTLYWPITNVELQKIGNGRCEEIVRLNNVVAKSIIYDTVILEALDGTGDVPDVKEGWLEEFAGLVEEAQEAAQNAEAASQAIQDMDVVGNTLEPEMPVEVTKSVDPETGAVTLTFGIPQGIQGERGLQGETGNGIASAVLNPDYTLTINFTDGTSYTTPSIRGAQGPIGETGDTGETGNGIASAVLNGDYTLTLTFTDGTSYTTPSIRGANGEPGQPGAPGRDGISPTATVTQTATGATIAITDAKGTTTAEISNGQDGAPGKDGQDGAPGQDGFSPIAFVNKSGGTVTISITDKNGTTTASVSDGIDGAPGAPGAPGSDGISPTITVTDITGGHRITITDATGPHSFDVPNGEDGEGVPAGGTTGQVLSKASGTDYDTEWTTPELGGVQDVQVNGTSVVSGGVANVPVATANDLGVVKYNSNGNSGVTVNTTGQLSIVPATAADVKTGVSGYKPIVPYRQGEAAFYGFAKAAGADMKNIASTTVGVYPEAQKSAISQMLNGSVSVSGSTPTITALPGIRYVCGEVATLDITLPASGIVDVVFESGSTPTVLTITPSTGQTLKWANGFDPTALETNAVYEITTRDGHLASALVWA